MNLLYRVKSERKTLTQYINAYIWKLDGNPICSIAKQIQM